MSKLSMTEVHEARLASKVPFRSAYDDVQVPGTVIEGESLTQQHQSDEADINKILEKWFRTGVLDHVNSREQVFADATLIPDYATAQLHINMVNDHFATLPATDRLFFNNDPGQYLSFVSDPANAETLVKMGLATAAQSDAVAASQAAASEVLPPVVD